MANKLRIDSVDVRRDYYINGVSLGDSTSLPNFFHKLDDDSDDIIEGSTNLFMTPTQETNFETAYTHSQTTTGNPHQLSSLDLTDGTDLFNKVTDDMDDILDGTTYVKTQNDFDDTYKTKLDSLEDIWTDDSSYVKMKPTHIRDLNMQDFDIDNVKDIQFKTDASNPAWSEGKVFYDNTKNALSYYNDESDITINLGLEHLIPVYNDSGFTITNGKVVYPTGTFGTATTIGIADSALYSKSRLIAMVTHDIENNSYGYATRLGEVSGVDTTGLSGVVYLKNDGSGDLTMTRPDAGSFVVVVGTIAETGVSGKINIDPNIAELSVEVTDTNGFPSSQRSGTTLSFNDTTREFTIAPTGTDFHYYEKGFKYEKTSSESIIIPNAEGLYVFYYDADTLSYVANPTAGQIDVLIRNNPLIAYVYWDATNAESNYFADERHGISMSPDSHSYLHFTRGAQFLQGYGLDDFVADGNGNLDTHAQFSIDSGLMADEDLITIQATPITSTTGLPIYYLDGSGAYTRRLTKSGFPVLTDNDTGAGTTGRLVYNQNVAGTWQTTTITNGSYVLYHIFGINGYTGRDKVISLMGQNEYSNISEARAGATQEISDLIQGFSFQELIPLGTVIYQTRDNYTNTVKARVVSTEDGLDYVDWRTSELAQGSNPTSHVNLTGVKQIGSGTTQGHVSDQPETFYGQKTFNEDIIINSNTDTFNIETKVIDVFTHATYSSVEYKYEINDGTNYRVGKIDILSDGTSPQIQDINNLNIGTSTGVTFSTAINGTDTELRVTSTSTGWTIKFRKNVMV